MVAGSRAVVRRTASQAKHGSAACLHNKGRVTAVGLIWYTYTTWETLEHSRKTRQEEQSTQERERDERRGSLGTGVLAELYDPGTGEGMGVPRFLGVAQPTETTQYRLT